MRWEYKVLKNGSRKDHPLRTRNKISSIESRIWKRFKKWWTARKVAIVLLILGFITGLGGYLVKTSFIFRESGLSAVIGFIDDFYANISAEAISIAITVLVIDALNKRRAEAEAKANLIRLMRTRDNTQALEMLEELHARGWTRDGSLAQANLRKANLHSAYLCEADLHGAKLMEANLTYASLDEANLTEVDLTSASLDSASLIGADLTRVILAQASLELADLRKANLSFADLVNADLSQADLREASLTGANLSGADFRSAKLGGAIMPDGTVHHD